MFELDIVQKNLIACQTWRYASGITDADVCVAIVTEDRQTLLLPANHSLAEIA